MDSAIFNSYIVVVKKKVVVIYRQYIENVNLQL